MRDIETIDSELGLLQAIRHMARRGRRSHAEYGADRRVAGRASGRNRGNLRPQHRINLWWTVLRITQARRCEGQVYVTRTRSIWPSKGKGALSLAHRRGARSHSGRHTGREHLAAQGFCTRWDWSSAGSPSCPATNRTVRAGYATRRRQFAPMACTASRRRGQERSLTRDVGHCNSSKTARRGGCCI